MEPSLITMDKLTAIFGWMTVINVGCLLFSTILLTVFKHQIVRLHGKLTGLDVNTLLPAYLYFLAFYKLLIIMFNLVPYLALKLL